MPGRVQPRVRLYHSVRTAHLERAAELAPAVILFGGRRYDFAPELARGLDLVPARGPRAAAWLFRHRVQTLEVNEPLMLPAARSTALALAGLAVGQLLGRPRTRVVSYAIENRDPTGAPPSTSLRRRLGHRLDLRLAYLVNRRVDRIAFGTAAAAALYASRMPGRPGRAETTIWALPRPATEPVAKHPDQVLFLGAFTERKGFDLVLDAWPLVRRTRPTARLLLIGQGPLQGAAERLAADDDQVELLVDPPRAEIRQQLARAQVLVLPSQPTAGWREQVGLPIVEGLAYGATVVTTSETGLAGWLAEHDHRVLPPQAGPTTLAEAVVDALQEPVRAVQDSLPGQDGRLAADSWMFA